ncbi:sodium:proton antiporter [Vibrio azureus]|uniref:Putative CPA1 family transporter n=1 Tax=Vibrio azureus NBRC 104587 TaxID=1219077 RepID=U3A7T1_9VIBR|nr:sodium:proton antiporter [Vibrio azureus]AUI88590.1 sodium:proton antiporter [Vibrio azureus]GAD76016.1 putative CPA1 family transporter [Vibrio azureus NBRC 104587]
MQIGNAALVLSTVGVIGLACQWLAWRVRLPAILFLLLAGILIGPILQWLNPDDLLGELLFPLVSLAVAVILFEGSLTLNLKEIRGVSGSVWKIVSFGAIFSWIATSVATHYLLGFSWELAVLFASLTIVTGPTVIVPILRTVRPTTKLANILRWEGILIDPLGALFAVMVYEFIVSHSAINSVEVFALIVVIGVIIGSASGAAVASILKRRWLPEYLQPFAVLMVVLGVFSLSNQLESEAGLLTVTVMGLWLANAKGINIQQILHFKEHLTILLITGLFIFLAARISIEQFTALGSGAILLFLFMQFISRPLSIFLSTMGNQLSFKEKAFLSWVAPRGIVAASISSLFAIKLVDNGLSEAMLLVPMTFMIIIGTVVLQSLTARKMASLLGVSEPAPHGFFIIGANRVAREIGLALKKYNRKVLLADSNWDYISQVRMLGMDYYYGNPISSHADDNLNLIGVGQVVALTPDQHFNIMACMHFVDDFGEDKVHCLQKNRSSVNEKHWLAEEYHGKLLMGGNVSYSQLASLFSQNAEIKHTKISENFTYEDYKKHYQDYLVIPLFYVLEKGKIQFCDVSESVAIPKVCTLVALHQRTQTNRSSG